MSMPIRLGFAARQVAPMRLVSTQAVGSRFYTPVALHASNSFRVGNPVWAHSHLRSFSVVDNSEANDDRSDEPKRRKQPKQKKESSRLDPELVKASKSGNETAQKSKGKKSKGSEGSKTGSQAKSAGHGSKTQTNKQGSRGGGNQSTAGGARGAKDRDGNNQSNKEEKKGRRVANPRQDRMASKILQVDRVTQATSSRKIYKFRALVAVGDTKGIASYGTAKGPTFRAALHQAYFAAMKDKVPMDVVDPLGCIYHDVQGEFNNTIVKLYASRPGSGIVAGPIVRGICDVVGIKNVSSKVVGPRNPYSVTYAMFNALGNIESPFKLATKSGRRVILSEYTKDA